MDDGINKALVFGSQILAVLIVVTGAAMQKAQLKSARPPGGGQVLDDSESGDRYARFWEDPLEGMQTFTPKVPETIEKREHPAVTELNREMQEQMIQLLQRLPQKNAAPEAGMQPNARAKTNSSTNPKPEPTPLAPSGRDDDEHLVFWNIIDARPTPEATEVRLRVRYALVSALVTAGYQPIDDAVLRTLRNKIPSDIPGSGKAEIPGQEKGELIGFNEIFEIKNQKSKLPKRITVAWLPLKKMGRLRSDPEDEKAGWPYTDFEVFDTLPEIKAALKWEKNGMKTNTNPRERIVILHHGSSGDFSRYVQAFDQKRALIDKKSRHQVIFTRATAQPGVIAGDGENKKSLQSIAESWQAGTPDKTLITELVKELKVRIPMLSSSLEKRIVIFTESDGAYGRNLAQLVQDHFDPENECTKVEVYGYLRGLDGLPGELAEDSGPDGGTGMSAGVQEKDWGTSQYDYLRRIAVQLRGTFHSDSPVVAIGVLGSDVYDKLLVLQAVKPELPSALYFTTDLQSLFLNREHLPFTRNLIVAAGEGLEIDEKYGPSEVATSGWKIPAMRDSYQTALVHTIWDQLAGSQNENHSGNARVWEVGQGRLIELNAGTRTDDPGWLIKLLAHIPVQFLIVFLGLVNAILILLAVLSRTESKEQLDGSRLEKKALVFLGIEAIGAAVSMLLLFGILVASAIPKPASLAVASGVTAFILLAAGLRQRARYLRSHPGNREPFLARLTGGHVAGSLIATSLFLFGLCWAIFVIGKEQHLFGEPLDPVSGVGMWPSILLRLGAFLVGLLLLIFTCKIFVEGGVRTKQELEVIDGISDRIGTTNPVTRSLRIFDAIGGVVPLVGHLQKFFGMKAGQRSGFFMDSCLDPAHRSRRIVLGSIFYFLISVILFSIWTPMVPGRGGLPFLIEKLTLSLGVGLYIVHLCLCVELHLCACGVILHLTKVVKENHELPMKHIVKIANAIGGITSLVGFTLLYPLTILSLLLISRLRIFDDWGMPPSLILTFVFGGIILVAVSVIIVVQSRKFSTVVTEEVARRLEEADKSGDEKELAEAGKDNEAIIAKIEVKTLQAESMKIDGIQEGAFAKWYRQPIFIAALAAAAIVGSLELAQPALSLFFE